MTTVFLPILERQNDELFDPLHRIGPVILSQFKLPFHKHCYLLPDHSKPLDLELLVSWLDAGAEKIIISHVWAKELKGLIPDDRLLLLLDVGSINALTDTIRNAVSGVLIKTPAVEPDLISSVAKFFSNSAVYVLCNQNVAPTRATIRDMKAINATLVIPGSQLTLGDTSNTQINISDAFLAPVTSDRPDHLFPTVVSDSSGHTLGLVYSSTDSIRESILSGKGVYQSRKHGLWRKGETSGATQDVLNIRLDCDTDALEFQVIQHGAGFCHLDRHSCFGQITGIQALENVLRSRYESAPEGSYTKRLYNDPDLLRSKIMEEADELCRGESKADIAAEAADLLYFALVKCIAAGVSVGDIEDSLDLKARRITRRPGNAKTQWAWKQQNAKTYSNSTAIPDKSDNKAISNSSIKMQIHDLSLISAPERQGLLRRPVLKSDEMIGKVKPIVEDVRRRGDEAILELTAKYDKAKMDSTVLVPPFPQTNIRDEVRGAIDKAYANVWKFHAAQNDEAPLVVETMPGVVCTRFARPIARVGLYVPGGTAVLPSTALMLGVPAQVAGCKEIVIATPPRPDGSITPEVIYVAHLVGASAILKAGGAQAVAALAFGTKTVPKVDKIFGPGNQWVTAAKMLVQNDTEALVSIDMPAGPSEVLVIADHSANPAYVAADLLSQAEHGVDSQVVLVAVDLTPEKLSEIEKEIDLQANALPRVEIMRHSIAKSIIVKVGSVTEGIKFSNDYAPEHLILHLEDAREYVKQINNAGSVFVGPYSPESCGDYASGTNHTLPTNGYARQFSGVNTMSYQKHITSQEITADGLRDLGPIVATLADCEELQAHANAVRVRLRDLQ